MRRLSVLWVSISVALATTTSAPAQYLYQSPDNSFYRYDANDGEDVIGPGTTRNDFDSLDGTWTLGHSANNWDGSEIGTGNPGGVTVAGGTIRVQDPGDPRDHGIPDPSNRRIVLMHNLSADGAGSHFIDDGVTFYFRARVPSTGDDIYPAGGGPVIPYPREGDGEPIHNTGYGGQLEISEARGSTMHFGLTTAFDSGASGGVITEAGLQTNFLNGRTPTGATGGTLSFLPLDTLQWHEYYITIQRGGSGTHQVTVFLDGGLTPAVRWDVTSGSPGGSLINRLLIPLDFYPDSSGSIEIDFLEVAPGAAPPRLACPSEGDTHCPVDGLSVSQMDGVPGEAGTYRAEVTGATDTSGDPILYTFTIVSDGGDAKVIGPQSASAAEFRLESGTHVVTATVDDSSTCPDETVDSTCGPVDLKVVVVEPRGPMFKRGDCNDDGAVDIADPISSLSFQFVGSFDPPCRDALDFDDNGIIDVSDPIGNLTNQFVGGPPPAPPGKENCGMDPTEDDLSCEGFAVCSETS